MTHTINNAKTVAVSTEQHWSPIDADTPKGVKVQLINKDSNVCAYGTLRTNELFWTHWAPVPKWPA